LNGKWHSFLNKLRSKRGKSISFILSFANIALTMALTVAGVVLATPHVSTIVVVIIAIACGLFLLVLFVFTYGSHKCNELDEQVTKCLNEELASAKKAYNELVVDNVATRRSSRLLIGILGSTNTMRDKNYDDMRVHIQNKPDAVYQMELTSKPREQLFQITEHVKNMFKEHFEIEAELGKPPLRAYLAYRIPSIDNSDNGWSYAFGTGIYGLSLAKILSGNSTFKTVVNSDRRIALYNNKQKAEKHRCYLKEPGEQFDSGRIGSIVCRYIPVVGACGANLIEAVLTVSTVGYPFKQGDLSDDEQEELEKDVDDVIFHYFETKFQIALLCLYFKTMGDRKQPSIPTVNHTNANKIIVHPN